ncbi:MAG: hypothetical protein HY253_05910 [Burkholderiales bacterium]|nr:hypothetical protein [Burkholderiales bacterium]
MKTLSTLSAIIFLSTALQTSAQSSDDVARPRDAEWMSYRDAYRSMLWFEKYGKPKNLIQYSLQIVPKDKSASTENLRLHLLSKSIHVDLPLDALGRTPLPLLKTAYDENAEIVLNQRSGQANFRFRISLATRADGIYEVSDLRHACEQALAFQSYVEPNLMQGKKCVGIRLGFGKRDSIAMVEIKSANQNTQAIGILDNTAMWPDTSPTLRTSSFLFTQQLEKAQLITRTSPLVMTAIIE